VGCTHLRRHPLSRRLPQRPPHVVPGPAVHVRRMCSLGPHRGDRRGARGH
jgi:hypothetical protein